ncbi:MAG: efflux RND transporter periplasmic adaptor subunit [Xanthobacteraceae bacterium]
MSSNTEALSVASRSWRTGSIVTLCALGLALSAGAVWISQSHSTAPSGVKVEASAPARTPGLFYPNSAQWATLTVEPVQQRVFRTEHVTEGKIAVDEDRSTPIFSPYAGRIMKLFVKPGDSVTVGMPLFTVQATDMVQAQNDFIGAATTLNKSRSALNLAQIIDKRQRLLYEGKAVPLKEVQNAKAALDAAENDLRSSEVALEAARNRLRILGKTDQEINEFQEKGIVDPSTVINSPIAGTVVQRKVGPGQYVGGSGSADPVFVIGDLSTVWVIAFIRETEAPKVQIGQAIYFTVLAYPERVFPANLSYVSTALDPASRRLLVRATVKNPEGLLKPEMFASVTILTGEGDNALSVPREAVIYEGDSARVWAVREDKGIELRRIKVGLASGNMVEVIDGLGRADRVVTKGSLFIDRAATGS